MSVLHLLPTQRSSFFTFVYRLLFQVTRLIVIQVPNNLTTSDQILFNITMLFPQYPILSQVDAFSTFLPLFYQHFGRLSNYVTFDKAWISGFISTVEVDVSVFFTFWQNLTACAVSL